MVVTKPAGLKRIAHVKSDRGRSSIVIQNSAADQLVQRGRKFLFQIFTRAIFIPIRPISAELMHPGYRFWRCFRPSGCWRVKKINIPGHVSVPPHTLGNGPAGDFMTIVIMRDPMVVHGPDTRNGRLESIVFKDRNPDDGSADIRLGILIKHILMHRPRTLVASQGTGG